MVLPDYNNSIVNVACSIQKYFDIKYNHNTIKIIDDILDKKKPSNVVVILFDGMGSRLIKRILPNSSFLAKNMVSEIYSTTPSTTTASTTSMLSGLCPNEHGWLGWNLYMKKEDKIVSLFTNTLKDSDVLASKDNLARKYYNYRNITEMINEDTNNYSTIISPHCNNSYTNIDDMFVKIKANLNKKKKNYIYAYYQNPDRIMHDTGTDSIETSKCFNMINNKVEEFVKTLTDTIVIIIADHGHINTKEIILSEYKDFYDTLDKDIWVEGRTCSFKVKENKEKEFLRLFNKYFGRDFLLLSKEEVINQKLFGTGINHKYFKDSLGNYFALATSDKYLQYRKIDKPFKSVHAGFSEDEMKIPLIIIDKKD